jgi:hypothetical protein
MHRVRGKLNYSNVVSTLCLVLLLGGGTAYAATRLGKESVGTAQLKKGAVTPAKLSKASVSALTGATGPVGPQGSQGIEGGRGPEGKEGHEGKEGREGKAGESATAIWANINADGTVKNASPAYVSSSAIFAATGSYEVVFDRDVSQCAYSVSPFDDDYTAETEPRNGVPDGVFVSFESVNSHKPDSFSLAVFC